MKNLLKIILCGPESTGKTTLARHLSEARETGMAAEYMREFCEKENRLPLEGDMKTILAGQVRNEKKAIKLSKNLLFCDTNALQLLVYHEHYFGKRPGWYEDAMPDAETSLYLLLKPDLPWKKDPWRDREEKREELFQVFRAELNQRKLKFKEVCRSGKERELIAAQFIEDFFEYYSD